MLKVLIADDSVVYRSQIRAALGELPWVEVVGTASNGKRAIEYLQQSPCDLLILDLEMPEMNGIQTLSEIAARRLSCKVLVFSSASKRGAEITLEALRLGAADFIPKPGSDSPSLSAASQAAPHTVIRNLLEPKLLALFPQTSQAGPGGASPTVVTPLPGARFRKVRWDLFTPKILVIASSTGGPTALEKIFAQLRPDLRCPIVITQHMPPIFTAALAERLQKVSGITAKEASHGARLEANTVYIAPGNYHLTLGGTKSAPMLLLNQGPLIQSVRPAADPLFQSAAELYRDQCLGLVLTGMGADGRAGAEKIKELGGAVVIQNEASCVVFGMPGAVMAVGAYDRIQSLEEIIDLLHDKVAMSAKAESSSQKAPKTGSTPQ